MKPLIALVAVLALAVPAGARADAAPPAIFQVGTAVVDITPTTPQYLGGYDQMDHGTTVANDPLQVRAFVVARGTTAVAFAIVDSQGWFAGYQEGPFGVTDARAAAASAMSASGLMITQADIIVSSTHSHAAPTLMGIWGPTDRAYLARVHDATVEALTRAAATRRDAELWTGSGSISTIIAHNVTSTDHYDGWTIDDDLSFLWARDPHTLATIGIYDDVPVHPDSYKGSGCGGIMSADTPGVVRSIVDARLGGTTVTADGTLGRQETIGPSGCGPAGVAEITRDGRYIANRLFDGLARAHPITDGTLAGAEQYVLTPGTNPALLSLLYANTQGFQCVDALGACTIDRSVSPPYMAGTMIGTYVTSLRIGDNVWVSEPGEAFPEVSSAIRRSVSGAGAVHVVGMAQDQLGYYYPPEDYPSTEMSPSDFFIYNVGPDLADANVRASALNATLLGYTGIPYHTTTGDAEPATYVQPGVQFFPIVTESTSATVSFTGYSNKSGAAWFFDQAPTPNPFSTSVSPPLYDFGDGAPPTVEPEQFDHTFPGPGTYDVRATTDDGQGNARTYIARVVVDAAPDVKLADPVTNGDGSCSLRASVAGGDGNTLAAHWRFGDGSIADGLAVDHAADPALGVAVTVVDGVGDTASGSFTVSCG